MPNSIDAKMEKPDEETRKAVREFYGVRQRPIPNPILNTLVRIYSRLPNQENNPLAEFAKFPEYLQPETYSWPKLGSLRVPNNSNGKKSDDTHDNSVPRREKEASHGLVNPTTVETDTFLLEGNCSRTDDAFSLLKARKDELSRANNSKTMEKGASEERSNNVGTTEIDTVEDVVNGKKEKALEANTSVSKAGADIPPAQQSFGRGMSSGQNPVNQNVIICPEEAQSKKRKHKASRKRSSRSSLKIGEVSTGILLDNSGKGNQVGAVTQGIINTGNTAEKTSGVDVELGKCKQIWIENGASNGKKTWSDSLMVPNNMLRGNPAGISSSPLTRKDVKSLPNCRARLRYCREQLLNFRKMASISEDMIKGVREIEAHVYGKDQIPTASKFTMASISEDMMKGVREIEAQVCVKDQIPPASKLTMAPVSEDMMKGVGVKDQIPTASKLTGSGGLNMEQLSLAENKKPEEKVSGILKTNKRGGSSEARKEKKKLKRRKKRAETNRKLGVKRLKLKPVVKPKVVQHCRHYLHGRCHEGEKCKFSHDVIPLTKSKPCCHFARQACMKGEDCPFDHQLSKYPCNNYVDTGFCGRGDSCLFSHKISAAQGGNAGGTNVQQNMVVGSASSLKNAPVDVPASSKHQAVSCPLLGSTSGGSSGDCKQQSLPACRENSSRFISFGKSPQNDSADQNPTKHLLTDKSGRTGGAVEIGTQLTYGVSSGATDSFKSTPTPPVIKGITLFSLDRHSADQSGGKSGGGVSSVHGETDSLSSFSEKASPSASGKSKEVQQELWGSQSSSGQLTTKVDLPDLHAPSKSQRALESVFAFAAKHGSSIKKSTAAVSEQINNNATTASGSGSTPREQSPVSAILQLLYGGSDKEKQSRSSNV